LSRSPRLVGGAATLSDYIIKSDIQTFIYTVYHVYPEVETMKNIKRNPNRMKKVPRRTAINWVDAMTPQGQALYAAEFVDNASGRHLLYKYQSSRNLQWSLEQEGKSL